MKTLVTGGAGFIGSHLVDLLLDHGHEVLVVDNLSTGDMANLAPALSNQRDRINFVNLDIRSSDLIGLVAQERPEIIFHLAAQMDVRVSVDNPIFDAETNILGTLNLLEGAKDAGTRKVVFASSGGTIYGAVDAESLPTPETTPMRPTCQYGVSKKAGGDYLRVYHELYGLDFTALALANVFGPRQLPHGEAGVVAIFANRLLTDSPCTIFGDGEQTRDYVHVDDVVAAFALAMQAGNSLVINVGTGRETSVNDLYALLAESTNSSLVPVYAPERPGELAFSCLDPSLAKHELGWQPQVSLRQGIQTVVDHFSHPRATQSA